MRNAMTVRKPDDDRPIILPCYVSDVRPQGCSVSHIMHPELWLWIELYSLIGADTPIAQALPLLDRVGATEEDLDVLLAMRSWFREASEEKREKAKG